MTLYTGQMADLYSMFANEIAGTSDEMAFTAALKKIGTLENKTVLDYGCGSGRTTHFLQSLNPALLVGVDRDEAMLRQARGENADFELVRSTGTEANLPFHSSSFDVAFSAYVICETASYAELKSAFSNLKRVLKPGGELFVITLNPEAFTSDSQFISYHYSKSYDVKDGDPITSVIHTDPELKLPDTWWSLKKLDGLFKESGFEIKDRQLPKAVGGKWRDETRIAPDVLYHLVKPQM